MFTHLLSDIALICRGSPPKTDPFIGQLCRQHLENFLLYLWPLVNSVFPLCPKLCTEYARTTLLLSLKSVVGSGQMHVNDRKNRKNSAATKPTLLLMSGIPSGLDNRTTPNELIFYNCQEIRRGKRKKIICTSDLNSMSLAPQGNDV